jgi:hypothetical protein
MEPFISGDNQIILNNVIGLPNDAPLSNFLNQFCQEFKYFSVVVRPKQIAAIQRPFNHGTDQINKMSVRKIPVFSGECSARICLQRAESFGK